MRTFMIIIGIIGTAVIWFWVGRKTAVMPIQTPEEHRARLDGLAGKRLVAALYSDGIDVELVFDSGDVLEMRGSSGGIYLMRTIERHPEQFKPSAP